MSDWVLVLAVFIALAAVVTLVAVLIHSRVEAGIRLPGRAEFYIGASRGGWRAEPQRQRSRPPPRPPSAKPRFYLEMKLRHGPNWVYPLDGKARVYIGRRADNDLRLTDPTADTCQAVIHWEGGRYKINNLSTRVLTRVNNRPITKQNLGNGNTIQMGRTRLIFRARRR